jgi:Family of unknown function (DUF5931)
VNIQASLWRSIAVFRAASLVYAAVLIVVGRASYSHPGWAWAVLAGMTGGSWSAMRSSTAWIRASSGRRSARQPQPAGRRDVGDVHLLE